MHDDDRVTTSMPDSKQKADDLLHQAKQFREVGDYEQALARLKEAAVLRAGHREAASSISALMSELKKGPEEVIQVYDDIIRTWPNSAEAYYHRGCLYAKTGKHEKAICDLTKAITLRPQFAFAYSERARAYDKLGLHELCFSDNERGEAADCMLETDDDGHIDDCMKKGELCLQQSKYEEAVAFFSQVIYLCPDNTRCASSTWFCISTTGKVQGGVHRLPRGYVGVSATVSDFKRPHRRSDL